MSENMAPTYTSVQRERSYDQRAKALIAFNTAEQAGKDRDDALQAAWGAMLEGAPRLTPSAEPVGEVYTMEALVPGGGVRCHVSLKRELPAGTKLFTGPQPDITAECAPYLKDGETPAHRIQREIDENATLLGLLAEERANAELMRKALESIASFQPKPASDDVAGWEEWNRAGEYAAGIAISALTAVRGAS